MATNIQINRIKNSILDNSIRFHNILCMYLIYDKFYKKTSILLIKMNQKSNLIEKNEPNWKSNKCQWFPERKIENYIRIKYLAMCSSV